jgi:sec-independent protein translocase protein TatC
MVEIQAGNPKPVDEVEASRMTLGEHLEELRTRLIRSVLVITVAFAVCWGFRVQLDRLVQDPYRDAAARLNIELHERAAAAIEISEDPLEWQQWYEKAGYPEIKELRNDIRISDRMKGDSAAMGFFYYMKMCLYFALLVGGPFLLYQMWAFIAAGLYKHERKVIHRYFPFSVLLFFVGVTFGYLVMIPNALYFLALQTLGTIQWYESVNNYWTFLVALTLALGVVFQLPIVMLGVARIGLVEPRTYAKFRPHMLVGSLIVAALLTPPDPFTQMMMAVPIAVLYELGYRVSRWLVKPSTLDVEGQGA